ncbi:MAG: ferritin-like domain-containing protein [Actinomycetota bacterium]|nr:ferritin-like domain-containing protein [Actinomycetota bacterium]
MEKGNEKLMQLLAEAHSNETALITTLNAHLRIAKSSNYKTLIKDHLEETKSHARLIEQRLQDLGYSENLIARGYQAAQSAVKQAVVLTKGPVDMIRGRTDVNEKMLRNAIDETMTEGLEIGAYDAIESLARGVGDHRTADLVSSIRLDEERMLQSLRKEIPVLAELVVKSEVPVSERASTEPWPGYDDMTVDEIENRLNDASESLVLAVRSYEAQNKNRTTVIRLTEGESVSS